MSIDIPSMLVGMKNGSPVGKDIKSFLIGKAVGGSPVPTYDQWATDSWETIRAVSKAGLTAEAYGNQVGATRDITLTDDTVMTLRLANATTDMYDRVGESGKTGLIVEFKDCFPDKTSMNSGNSNAGGWNATIMRTETMGQLLDLLPSDLKSVIATVGIKTANGGSDATEVVTSSDKLFLPAEYEVFGARTNSWQTECDSLTRWKYYADNTAASSRYKKIGGTTTVWWLRSPNNSYTTTFVGVNASGASIGILKGAALNAVSPAFCI